VVAHEKLPISRRFWPAAKKVNLLAQAFSRLVGTGSGDFPVPSLERCQDVPVGNHVAGLDGGGDGSTPWRAGDGAGEMLKAKGEILKAELT
jgi:hypothetical protein